jgi:hypothetical protein
MKKFILLTLAVAIIGLFNIVSAADATGKWTASSQAPDGTTRTQTFDLKADGATLTGTVSGGRGEPTPIANGKVDGDTISFEVTRSRGGNSFTQKYTGKVSGDRIVLSVAMPNGSTREVTATKAQ